MRLRVEGVEVELSSRPILSGVDVTVNDGGFVGLVGPNGSGKSTVLRTIYRSLRPHGGTVRVGDADVWSMTARQAALRTAAVLQDDSAPVGMTAAEMVELGRNPHRGLLDRADSTDRAAVTGAMRQVGVEHLAERAVTSLSGGERQRVLLARALAQQPRLLVLDEPTNHLDIRARFEVLELLREIELTTLTVLHDLDLAVRSCTELVVLHQGRVAAAGPVLDALRPEVLREVFGVAAEARRCSDGVIRMTYHADPLVSPSEVH